MSVALYMDAHVPGPVTRGLRLRNVTVLTAQEDGTDRLPDPALLDRATQLGYVLVSNDVDFLMEASRRQSAGEVFLGLIFSRQQTIPIGKYIDDLEMVAKVNEPLSMQNCVQHLPL